MSLRFVWINADRQGGLELSVEYNGMGFCSCACYISYADSLAIMYIGI